MIGVGKDFQRKKKLPIKTKKNMNEKIFKLD